MNEELTKAAMDFIKLISDEGPHLLKMYGQFLAVESAMAALVGGVCAYLLYRLFMKGWKLEGYDHDDARTAICICSALLAGVAIPFCIWGLCTLPERLLFPEICAVKELLPGD